MGIAGSITRNQGGIGMGLTVVQQMLRQLRGNIDVTSELCAGSVFDGEIPLRLTPDELNLAQDQHWWQQLKKYNATMGEGVSAFVEAILLESPHKMVQLNQCLSQESIDSAIPIWESLQSAGITLGAHRLANAIDQLREKRQQNIYDPISKNYVDLS